MYGLLKFLDNWFIIVFILFLLGCKEVPVVPPIDPDEPTANAGVDQTINVGSYLILDGRKSDRKSGNKIIFKWTQDLSNPEQFTLFEDDSIRFKTITKEGIYKFTLVVNNGIKDSKPSDLKLVAKPRISFTIPDLVLEANIRFSLNKQSGELTEFDFLSIDSLFVLRGLPLTSKISNLQGIERCKNIKQLGLTLQSISDLTPLSNLTMLEELYLDQNFELSDVTPLANLINLKHLEIGDNNVTDISSLVNLKNLTYLGIHGSLKTHVKDISVVKNFKGLKSFISSGLSKPDLSVFRELTELEEFYCSYSNISDISDLKNCTRLKLLLVHQNEIKDLTPIKNLIELQAIWLNYNKVEDLSPVKDLENLQVLYLDGNLIQDLKPLIDNKGLGKKRTVITLRGNPLNEKSINEYIPQLIARGIDVVR